MIFKNKYNNKPECQHWYRFVPIQNCWPCLNNIKAQNHQSMLEYFWPQINWQTNKPRIKRFFNNSHNMDPKNIVKNKRKARKTVLRNCLTILANVLNEWMFSLLSYETSHEIQVKAILMIVMSQKNTFTLYLGFN